MLLHTFNKSPYRTQTLTSCLELFSADDALVLLEDGVYAGTHPDLTNLLDKKRQVYAIEADVQARGLLDRMPAEIQIIDYAAFVALCCEYPKQKTW